MSLKLRPTTETDLPFVVETEHEAAKKGVVTAQTLKDHEEYLKNRDVRHLIIESEKRAVGYAILAGVEDKNESIELRRIVVAESGKGFGRRALREIKRQAFENFRSASPVARCRGQQRAGARTLQIGRFYRRRRMARVF